MTTFTTIPDVDINPDKPIKSETAYALRDNPLAIAEGDSSAPSINPAALFIGGKGGDGIWDNSASFSASGFYEFSSMNRTTAMNLPTCSIIRIAGNATLSNTLTVQPMPDTTNNSLYEYIAIKKRYEFLGPVFGFDLTNQSDLGDGGGASAGRGAAIGGGSLSVETGIRPDLQTRFWSSLSPIIGGAGRDGSGSLLYRGGGGALILIIEGNATFTGGTIACSVPAVAPGSGTGKQRGGGSITVICTGSIAGGTFNAPGGIGTGATSNGGGGYVQLVATNYSGTQTADVSAGSGASAGYYNKLTLTRDQIRTILQRY